ncbi:hypothetical protein I7X12_01750 [Halosimplex litoreum]|uniref:Uncharacterized protein n=1 Tax=Halosimplex litoreum TaxID=1198301 RepID=A0A7T3KVQ4_9EURY|nr:hypothetical protein [Halosimplex litoreum]QPV63384.1 hypothetical protein I7X12_01750 [Halosimplex litoreum]
MGAESSPRAAFELASNDTRMAILHELAEAFRESPIDPFVAYSDLREGVGVRDKGNFNYHLDRLGDLVTEGSDGYAVSSVGLTVVSAVASGSLDPDWTWGPADVPGECSFCGDALALRYENGHLLLTCGVDDHALLFPVSPSLLDGHEGDALLERVAVVLTHQAEGIRRGVCPECEGDLTPGIVPEPKPEQDGYFFHGDCRGCGFQHGFPVGAAALSHPEVVAAYATEGIDLRATPFWTLEWCRVGAETVVAEDPLRVRVDVRLPEEMLIVTLDGDADVVSVEGRKPSE